MTTSRSGRTRIAKDKVYEVLVDEILKGELEPGSPLSERALVDRFGLSRTPIRQVLWRLERDDLVVLHPHRGAFLRHMGVAEIVELFQLREALEPLACSLAAARRPQADLAALSADLHRAAEDEQTSAGELVALGERLHDALVRWSGNRMLARIYEMLRMHTRLMRNLLHGSLGAERESLREHLAIVAAVEAQDVEGSREAMAAHLRRSRQSILEDLYGHDVAPAGRSDRDGAA